MSKSIFNAPTLSNEEILSAWNTVGELVAKRQQMQLEIEEIDKLIQITKLVSTCHLGVPINISIEKYYVATLYKISNVTPTSNQFKTERSAEYIINTDTQNVSLTLKLNNPHIAQSTFDCPTEDIAKEIAMDFVATGKFPQLNQLLCKFKRQAD